MKIIRRTSTANTTAYNQRPIDYIVIHYTAGTSAKKGTALSIASYFSRTQTQASADFIVDRGDIVQYNPDIKNRYCWSVGGEKYSKMSTSEGGKFYGKCRNTNSISIEMCSEKKDRTSVSATDKDWYIPAIVKIKTRKLTKKLMKQYGIDWKHVIMHHHVTGKLCPQPWVLNESRLKKWKQWRRPLKLVKIKK